jgi:hypothetical protein
MTDAAETERDERFIFRGLKDLLLEKFVGLAVYSGESSCDSRRWDLDGHGWCHS